ncbi:hypothetical protein CCMA1212_008308 [Trichoderma ghanense]|uniref:Uncharacterized protein n=1 Tax=Trichoderma ghanense TaxID=65468 RepID=A0ABY2GVW3_9HYPO
MARRASLTWFGEEYTIVDFSDEFSKAAERLSIPLKRVHLPTEKHVRDLWERNAVLIRPDDHVAWKSPLDQTKFGGDVEDILKIAAGLKGDHRERVLEGFRQKGFAGTVGNVKPDKMAMKAGFQRLERTDEQRRTRRWQ